MKKVLIAVTMLGVAAFAPVAQAHDHWQGYDGWHGDYGCHHRPYYHHHHSHVFIGFGFEPPVYYSPSYYDHESY